MLQESSHQQKAESEEKKPVPHVDVGFGPSWLKEGLTRFNSEAPMRMESEQFRNLRPDCMTSPLLGELRRVR